MTDPQRYGETPQPPAGYGEYPPPGGYGYGYGYPPKRPTNSLAIVSLVCAFLFAPLGIVFGHMSLSQIKRTGDEGHGLAVAGLVISYLIVVASIVVTVISVIFVLAVASSLDHLDYSDRYPGPYEPSSVQQPLPEFKPPKTLGSNCQYPATTEPASKPVTPPPVGSTPTAPETIPATLLTNQGDIGLELDNQKAPCTVKNFESLAEQGFFDSTSCHRLTISAELHTLQCGDPTATGNGGPGYRFPNEYPSNQYRLSDPAMTAPVTYPRGTLAMANTGPGTNGSQFFLVYEDSQLPPTYTVFGTVDAKGLAALDKIAAGGVAGGTEDGKPVTAVTLESVRIG